MENSTIGFFAGESRNIYWNGQLMGGEVRNVTSIITKMADDEKMRLADFYQKLNQAVTGNRFERWATHRNAISKFMTEIFERTTTPRVLIIGSGNCDDLDLDVIQRYAASVTFVDLDESSTRNALELRAPELLEKSTIMSKDVLGLADELEQLRGLLEHHDAKAIMRFFKKLHKRSSSEPFLKGKFDVVIVLPIFSQLVAPYLLASDDGRTEDVKYPIHKINAELVYLANMSTELVLNQILDCIELGGYVFAVSDLFNARTSRHIKYFEGMRPGQEVYERIMRAASEGGVHAGALGYLRWFDTNRNYFKLIVSATWLWDFDDAKMYGVKSFSLQKISEKQMIPT